MRKRRLSFILAFLLVILPVTILFSRQQQRTEQHAATSIGRYEKYELTYPYSGTYSNPNDPSQVDVEGIFTAPSGSKQTVPGFYNEEYANDTPTGNKNWKVRFAPSEIGNYLYTVTVKDSAGIKTLGSGTFNVISSNNHGFVRANGVTYVRDDGTGFFPIGINVVGFHADTGKGGPWNWGAGYTGVDNMINLLSQNGMNFFAIWTCSWNPGANTQPYARPNIGCDTTGDTNNQMDQKDSALIDYLVDQIHAKDMYFMPTLKHHHGTWDVPHDPLKERYFVARWGYSTNVAAWDSDKESATDPVAEKAYTTFMVNTDPYQHLRTTNQWNNFPMLGQARLDQYNAVFSDPQMTLVNNHDYMEDCNDTLHNDTSLYYFSLFSGSDPRNSARFNKPNMNGEGGLRPCGALGTGSSSFNTTDTNGVIIKGYAWGTFMSTLCGCTPWSFTKQQLVGYKGLRAYTNALPVIPLSANAFTTYNDTSQATVSTPLLRIIGRKNATFAMVYIQNTTGTWAALVRDHTAPQPIAGTITLKNMTGNFTVKWFDTDTGTVIKTESVSANGGNVVLTTPQTVTQSIALFATTGTILSITPTGSTTHTPTVTPNPNSTVFSLTFCPHGLGNCGDNVASSSGGNSTPLHNTRNITLSLTDTNGTAVLSSSIAGQVAYVASSQNFQGSVSVPNIASGQYLATVKMDGYLAKLVPGIVSVTKGYPVLLPSVSLVTGDITNNNQVDILDYNALIGCFGVKVTASSCLYPPTSTSPGADILDDGPGISDQNKSDPPIDGGDYNEFIRELSVQKGN